MGRRKDTPSLEDLSAVIATIHDAVLDSAAWLALPDRIARLFRSSSASVWMQGASGELQDMHVNRQGGPVLRDYAAYYERLDKLRPAVMRAPVGTVLTNEMVVRQAEFVRTEFYADFALPHDVVSCMQARVFDDPGGSGYVGIGRTSQVGTFEREDIRLLRLLLPHLRGAQRTRQHLALAGIERGNALAALDGLGQGVLIVDAQARVLHANPAAEALLRLGDGLATAQGRLRALRPADDAELRRALCEGAGNGGSLLAVARPSGRAPFALTMTPVSARHPWASGPWRAAQVPAALVFVVEPDQGGAVMATRTLRALYGLTAAEAAVAGRVAEGQGVKDAAEALGVTPSTLRWHLRTVFDKTGTARQADLVRLVERLGAVAGGLRGQGK